LHRLGAESINCGDRSGTHRSSSRPAFGRDFGCSCLRGLAPLVAPRTGAPASAVTPLLRLRARRRQSAQVCFGGAVVLSRSGVKRALPLLHETQKHEHQRSHHPDRKPVRLNSNDGGDSIRHPARRTSAEELQSTPGMEADLTSRMSNTRISPTLRHAGYGGKLLAGERRHQPLLQPRVRNSRGSDAEHQASCQRSLRRLNWNDGYHSRASSRGLPIGSHRQCSCHHNYA